MLKKPNSYPLVATTVLALSFYPLAAFAHTGIGGISGFGAGFIHPLLGLDHLLAMVAVGLWASWLGGRSRWLLPLTFVAVMLAGGLVGMKGFSMPYVEAGILASVMILGLLIATGAKSPRALSILLIGFFALFHGHAHGTELPAAAGALSYSIGFVLTTGLLHLTGILAGVVLTFTESMKTYRFAGAAIALSGLGLLLI